MIDSLRLLAVIAVASCIGVFTAAWLVRATLLPSHSEAPMETVRAGN